MLCHIIGKLHSFHVTQFRTTTWRATRHSKWRVGLQAREAPPSRLLRELVSSTPPNHVDPWRRHLACRIETLLDSRVPHPSSSKARPNRSRHRLICLTKHSLHRHRPGTPLWTHDSPAPQGRGFIPGTRPIPVTRHSRPQLQQSTALPHRTPCARPNLHAR